MNITLQRHFDRLEQDRQQLLTSIRSLSSEQLNAKTPKGGWSINQIVAHLITAEGASLLYMKKKSLGLDTLKNAGRFESMKLVVLQLSQRMPFLKFKAPKYVVENTPTALSYDALDNAWRELRDDLRKFLEGIEDKDVRKMIYKHPVAGYLSSVQAIIFFREHLHHHLPQIKRLLRQVK